MKKRPTAQDHEEVEAASLLAKYRELTTKYEALVEKFNDAAGERQQLVALAAWTMRTSSTALAIVNVDTESVGIANEAFLALAHPRSAWRLYEDDQPGPLRFPDLRALVIAMALELADGAEHRSSVRCERVDASQVLDVRLERVPSATRQVTRVVALAVDATDRVRAERELARARIALVHRERLHALGLLAAGIAHDLGATCHALTLRAAMLADDDALDPKARRAVADIEDIVRHAAGVIGRLHDFARPRGDAERVTDVRATVERAVEMSRALLAEHRGAPIEVTTHVAAGLPAAAIDASELTHALVNLLLNARDAMPDGGRIEIAARRDGDRVVLAVRDEGTGFAAENLAHVFEPFFTTKGNRGTGLGLSTAQSAVNAAGGTITAANRTDRRGAVVTMRLPVATTEAAPAPRRTTRRLDRRHVLLVDDDEASREATAALLDSLGARVTAVADGAAALRALDHGRRRFDVVVCEPVMQGVDGWQVADAAAARTPPVPVVFVTAFGELVRDQARWRGRVRAALAKPVDAAALVDALAAPAGPSIAARRAPAQS